jgi:DNA-binding IclR family transcriptional regulator
MASSPLYINSLDKGLTVLEAFRHHPSMNLQEMAKWCAISTSSAQRVAYTLEQMGYLDKDTHSKRYRLSVKAMGLGYTYLANEPLFQSAHAILHQLNQQCGESVNLSVPDGDDMVFVMRIHTFKHIPIYMPIGTRIPVFSSASGRAVLSCLPATEIDRKLEAATLEKFTSRSTLDKDELRQMILQAHTDGFATADEEYFQGDVNVAAAVLDDAHRPVAAVNISVPKPRWSLEKAREELGPLVARAARAISQS